MIPILVLAGAALLFWPWWGVYNAADPLTLSVISNLFASFATILVTVVVVDWTLLEAERRRTRVRDEGVQANLRAHLAFMILRAYEGVPALFTAAYPALATAEDVPQLMAHAWPQIRLPLRDSLASALWVDVAAPLEDTARHVDRLLWLTNFGARSLPPDCFAQVLDAWQLIVQADEARKVGPLSATSLASGMGADYAAAIGRLALASDLLMHR